LVHSKYGCVNVLAGRDGRDLHVVGLGYVVGVDVAAVEAVAYPVLGVPGAGGRVEGQLDAVVALPHRSLV
jgi:hypothetical protein